MKALVLKSKEEPFFYDDWKEPDPGEDEVVVDLQAAALNHRDVFITQGLYPGIQYPSVLGSDGAGVVDGREVLINPAMNWGDNPRVQSDDFHILGLPRNGTFAEKVAVPEDKIYDKPGHLSWGSAAALPLAGLTAYRALFTRGLLQSGERLLITGIGGGVALLAMQFAMAAGAEVWVTSSANKKIDHASAMGAKGGANYQSEDWEGELRQQAGSFDLILDSAGGEGFAKLVKLCRPGGRLVTYGGTLGRIPKLSPQVIFWRQLSILGSTMGTDKEFAEMLAFVSRHEIQPEIDEVFPLSQGPVAFERMDKGLQFGKIVFRIKD